MNFKQYVAGIKKVNPLMARCFLYYLKKNNLYEKFEHNINRHPCKYYPIKIEEAAQFMGCAFNNHEAKEGYIFWWNQISNWVNYVKKMEYTGYMGITRIRRKSNNPSVKTPF